MAKKKLEWKKVGEKFLWAFAEVLVAGGLAYVSKRPELLLLAPLLRAARNWLKHR